MLEKAIDHGNLGQVCSAVTHSKSAVEHLAAANDAANAGNSKSGKKKCYGVMSEKPSLVQVL